MFTCGIYCIRNTFTQEVYVGASIRIEDRWAGHRRMLRRGGHHSNKLQKAWDRWGESQFEFQILEVLPLNDSLPTREQHWINQLNAFCGGYNARPRAESMYGYKRPPFSTMHRQRIAQSKQGENNPNYGKARPATVRAKIALGNTGVARSAETKARVKASRITPAHPRYVEHAAEQRRVTLQRVQARGLARLQRELEEICRLLNSLTSTGLATPARWNRRVVVEGLGLCHASLNKTAIDPHPEQVVYGMPWGVFLRTVADLALRGGG